LLDGLIVGIVIVVVVALLAVERASLRRMRHRLPLRIAVTGTRGKSSTVRLIAAGLSAAGYRVSYKTTGSQAVLGHPDGRETPIRRRGIPSPIEQRRVLRECVRDRATALVAEAMSIRAESLRVELRRILDPQWVVVTNIRADHVADLVDPDRAFADAVPGLATVICPADISDRFRQRLSLRSERTPVLVDVSTEADCETRDGEHPDNVILAEAACHSVGVPRDIARAGMQEVRPDIGAFHAWSLPHAAGEIVVVNAFAANDPDSTRWLLQSARKRWNPQQCIGLLNLRRDRGDRTAQWIRALSIGDPAFDALIVVGEIPYVSSRPVRRAYGDRCRITSSRDPSRIQSEILAIAREGALVFGFGNIGGVGLRLVERWKEEGRRL
jgi:gamma-polyglutamate synthase